MTDPQPTEKVLTGVAGEYFVAAELSKRGYIASITLRNTRGVDIVCSSGDASKSVAIQVKTNRHSNRDWILNQKSEDYFADNLFYVFVNLHNNTKTPDYFVVPSKDVAEYTKTTHSEWLSGTKKNGTERTDTPMRKFSDLSEIYRDKWELLGL